MNLEHLTPIEDALLREVVRPAITKEERNGFWLFGGESEKVDFSVLLQNVRDFYERNGGRNWPSILSSV